MACLEDDAEEGVDEFIWPSVIFFIFSAPFKKLKIPGDRG